MKQTHEFKEQAGDYQREQKTREGKIRSTRLKGTAAAAKSLVVSDSVRPHRRQPTRLRSPWDSLGKNTGVGCHFLLQCMKVKSESEVAQSCPTLCNSMDCSLPSSPVHGILQARVLEWGPIAFSVKGTTTYKINKLHDILYSKGNITSI